MKTTIALDAIGDIAEQQYGLFTTRQAESVGVPRLSLSRLNDSGLLDRVTQGVYRVHGTPRDIHEGLRADWLALDPARTAPERLADRANAATVSHRSAANVHGIGDFPAGTHHFVSPTRKQSGRARVTVPRKPIDPASITIVEGLPVTTVERTIADLAKTEADISHVADAAADADTRGELRHDILAHELEPVASVLGARSGIDAVQHLLAYRGLDTESLANAVLANSGFQATMDALTKQFASAIGGDVMAAFLKSSGATASLVGLSEAVFGQIHPVLDDYLATSGVLSTLTQPALQEIARNAYGPHFAALRSVARASTPKAKSDTAEHA